MFVECHVRAISVHPRAARTLFLGTEQGLFRSDDGAENWKRVESPLNGLQIWSMVLLPHAPDVMVVGTCPSRLFRTDDGGRTWTEPSVGMRQECPRIMHTRITTIIADPVETETIWAGVEIDGVYRSRDAGKTWQKLGQGLSSLDIHGLAIVPQNGKGKRLLASTNNDMNLSTDDGETWQPMKIGQRLPWSYCRGMAQQSRRPESIFLGNGDFPPGTIGLVAVSRDGGQSWGEWQVQGGAPLPRPNRANSTMWNFAVHPANPDLIYASSISGQVFRSADGGNSWERLSREFGEIRALAWAPSAQ
jgi:photosystem II stability/assembly factor-like uncharacterized protein